MIRVVLDLGTGIVLLQRFIHSFIRSIIPAKTEVWSLHILISRTWQLLRSAIFEPEIDVATEYQQMQLWDPQGAWWGDWRRESSFMYKSQERSHR